MNAFTKISILYVFIMILLFAKFINITDEEYIKHKIMIFIVITIGSMSIDLISKVANGCPINLRNIFADSIRDSLYCILGYSIYLDLITMKGTRDLLGWTAFSKFGLIMVGLIIISFLVITRMIELLYVENITCKK